MKHLSSLRLLLPAALASLCLALPSAKALPIQVAYDPVLTQPSNNGIGTLTTWATNAIATYNANSYAGAPLPDLGAFAFQILPTGDANSSTIPAGWPTSFPASTTMSITLPLGGYNYLILSWGGSQIPQDRGTADFLYYIGGTSGNVTFNRPDLAGGGLSGVTVFGGSTPPSVPDGGSSALLLGAGLVGVGLLRRRPRATVSG